MTKPTALESFLKHHKPTCSVHIYSGDRHCSCGRDAAEKEYLEMKEKLKEVEAENYDEYIQTSH